MELHTLDYRHTAVGIGRVVVGESFSKGYQDEVGEVEEAEVDKEGESALELQSARTTAMGVGNYSVPIDIVKHLSIRSIDAFRPLSTLWHRFLGLDGGKQGQEELWEDIRNEGGVRKRQERNWGDGNRDDGLVVRQKETQAGDEKREAIYKAMQQVLG